MKVSGRHYATGELIDIEVTGGQTEQVAEAGALWLAPSLFDNQVNGYGGYDFNSDAMTAGDVIGAVRACWQSGTGRLCPTVTTGAPERMVRSLRAIAEACNSDPLVDHAVVGIHVEGPYISSEDGPRGAHPLEHVRLPDWAEFVRFQDAAGGRIKLFTLAPEVPGALPFIEQLTRAGVVVALGHHAAPAEIVDAAIQAGARTSTHLGNAAHAQIRRHPNYIWEQLARDELWCSLIVDGHHLPPSVVKVMLRAKGVGHTILTSDALYIAGMLPGVYRSMGLEIEVTPQGRAQLRGTPYLAGAALPLAACIGNVVRFADVSLQDAIEMATLNPLRLLGLQAPPLADNPRTDALAFTWDAEAKVLTPKLVVLQGQVVGRDDATVNAPN